MPDPSVLLPLLALLAAAGAFAGFLAGLLGVGGGIVHVPAFFFVFSTLGHYGPQLMQVCLATSLAAIVVTSARSVMAHHRHGAVDWSILRGWAPGIALGALLGVAVAARLRSEVLEVIFGGVATGIGLYLALGRDSWRLGPEMPQGPLRWGLAPGIGFLSVLLGIGGGSLGVPVMTLFGVSVHRAVATAAGFGGLIAVPSALAFLTLEIAAPPPGTLGAVNLPALAVAVTMTLLTAPLGARAAHALPPRRLRLVFAGFIVVVALNMLRQALWT